jgi:hypothetical protein
VKNLYLSTGVFPQGFFDGAVERILDLQLENGSIPWFDGGVFDPWNHIEAAMGLAVAGRYDQALRAYRFLADSQLADGSWWGQYGSAVPMDDDKYTGDGGERAHRDTNFAAYMATGVWHQYLITGDLEFAKSYWPVVKRAVDFVLELQHPEGDIRWAANDPHTPEDDALITGCSSIYKSLECAILLANKLNEPSGRWRAARARLGDALRHKPHRFDRQWETKERFSMDWYYPVLCGAFSGDMARARLSSKWDVFVAEGHGCRCVEDQPWVTVAESCELTMALLGVGQDAKAKEVYSWQHRWRADDGAYWMGYQYEMDVAWPAERPAWTAGAALLAADALAKATPACELFTRVSISEATEKGQRFYHR